MFAGLHAMLADDRMDYGDARYISAEYLGGPLVVPVWTPCGSARCIISMRHAHGKEEAAGSSILDSGDDAPELTDAFFAAATVREGDKVVRRRRPKLTAPKQLVTIRFSAETLGRLRAMGRGPGDQGAANRRRLSDARSLAPVLPADHRREAAPRLEPLRMRPGAPTAVAIELP